MWDWLEKIWKWWDLDTWEWKQLQIEPLELQWVIGMGGAKVLGALRNVWKEWLLSGRAKMGIYEDVVVGSVAWMQGVSYRWECTEEVECTENEMFKNDV